VRTYLDHASTSPLRPEARDALVDALGGGPVGDPGRIHAEGLAARVAVEAARDRVAALLGARNREVVFTSGATEAIAAACWGAAQRSLAAGAGAGAGAGHQVVSAVEHSAVRLAADRHGPVTIVPVDGAGRVAVDDVLAAVRPDTALVHVQWGNHEVGTVQPVADVVAACRERGVLVHVDAAQAAGHVPIAFDDLGADLLTVSAHKLGGPPGVGALLVRRGVRLAPLLVGGDQERARRAGLENVPGVVAFGAACAALAEPAPGPGLAPEPGRGASTDAGDTRLHAEAATQRRLTGRIVDGVAALDGLVLYGPPVAGTAPTGPAVSPGPATPGGGTDVGGGADRLPHIACFGVAGIEPQAVLLGLDRAGIAAHSGSACSSEALEPSPVLQAMGVDAHHSLRLSVGWSTTDADVDRLLAALPPVLAELRALATG
jgi:cysteine desulfurase